MVDLKWSDILITIEGTKFFKIDNKKVNRQKSSDDYVKYLPINSVKNENTMINNINLALLLGNL